MLQLIWLTTGWNGTGKRISIKDTPFSIIDAILDGSIENAEN